MAQQVGDVQVSSYVFSGAHVKRIGSGWVSLPADRHLVEDGASAWENRLVSKWYKMRWPSFREAVGADVVVWCDAKTEIVSATFAGRATDMVLDMPEPLAMWLHDNTWADEVGACHRIVSGDQKAKLSLQAAEYASAGIDAQRRVYTSGLIVFDPTHVELHGVLNEWWQHNKAYSTRDQVSLPWVLWRRGLSAKALGERFAGNWKQNEVYRLHRHA
jgi:hypothetical protein